MTARTCAVCDQQVDPDDAHWPHETGCTRHDCACDLPTCPGCCPDCNPRTGRVRRPDGDNTMTDTDPRWTVDFNRVIAPDGIDCLDAHSHTNSNALAKHVATALNDRDALCAVVRRLLEGWMPVEEPVGEGSFNRWYLEPGIDDGPETDALGNQPMTTAEADVIRRAREAG